MKACTAESVPKPAVPEFGVQYIDYSYDVPSTYGIDQFTGKTVIIQQSYRVDQKSVQLIVKNQQYASIVDDSGNTTTIYYNFRYKGAYGDEWRYYPFGDSGQGAHRFGLYDINIPAAFPATDSQYTNITLYMGLLFGVEANELTIGDQIDFQVQAQVGHINPPIDGFYSFSGQKSEWSPTQTITIGENSVTTAPQPNSTNPAVNPTEAPATTPTSTPTSPNIDNQPETVPLDTFIAVTVALTLTITALTLLLLRRQRKTACIRRGPA
jgi:hypothetical protein